MFTTYATSFTPGFYALRNRNRPSRNLPTSYFAADTRLGKRSGRKIANNTQLIREAGNVIALYLHNTPIVRWHLDGRVQLRSGGWRTVTTKARINAALDGTGWQVWSDRGQWYVVDIEADDSIRDGIEFTEGVTIHLDN